MGHQAGSSAVGYRPDIDGLRAVAVSLVVVFHAFPSVLPGGFAGVDVFFVISGYLISSIILAEHRAGRYSILAFYKRRIRRIFPALLAVFAACLGAGWLLLLPGELGQLGKHVAGGAGFISNILFWDETGYFDAAAELKPLLHLWSLGVEEQFYIFWPVLLWGIVRLGRRPAPLILGLAALSFAVNLWQVGHDPSAAYFLPLSRFWELMLGGLLAGLSQRDLAVIAPYRSWVAAGGAGLIVLGAALLDAAKPFPGWWGLLPTLGAVALIAAGPGAWVNRVVLARPLMVGIGLISYPLYLWHWPLLAFTRIHFLGAPAAPALGAAAAASVVLAWATYRFIEQPLRRRPQSEGNTQAVALGGLMAVAGAAGIALFAAGGVPARMPEVAAFDAAYANYRYGQTHDLATHDRQECNFYDIAGKAPRPAIAESCTTPRTGKSVLVWGDSHAQHLQYGLRKALEPGVSVLQVGASGCRPSLVPWPEDPLGSCTTANRHALERIAAVRPTVVVLAQQNGHEHNDFAAIIARLHGLGVAHVVLVGPVPQWTTFLYEVVQRAYRGHPPRRLTAPLDPGVPATDRILTERFAGRDDVTYVSLVRHLCTAEGCLVYDGDDPLEGLVTYDYGHLTLRLSDRIAGDLLVPALRPWLE